MLFCLRLRMLSVSQFQTVAMAATSLWNEAVQALGGRSCQAFREAHGVFGYVVVGSSAVLGSTVTESGLLRACGTEAAAGAGRGR